MTQHLPIAYFLKGSAVQQPYLRKQHRIHKGHLHQLLQVQLHRKLILFLLHHKCHSWGTGPYQCHSLGRNYFTTFSPFVGKNFSQQHHQKRQQPCAPSGNLHATPSLAQIRLHTFSSHRYFFSLCKMDFLRLNLIFVYTTCDTFWY